MENNRQINQEQQHMQSEQEAVESIFHTREFKLVLGIVLTITVLVLLVVIIVFAINSQSKTTQLLSGKYDYVASEMYDGVVIVSQDGDYKLVKDDLVISSSYNSLIYDSALQTYHFITSNGYAGEIDSSGSEIYRRKIAGTEIMQDNRTSTSFYIDTRYGDDAEDGSTSSDYVIFDGEEFGPYNSVLTHVEAGIDGDVPIGVFAYVDTQTELTYITSAYDTEVKFLLEDDTQFIGDLMVVIADSESDNKAYLMPTFEYLSLFDGQSAASIYYANSSPILYEYESSRHVLDVLVDGEKTKYYIEQEPVVIYEMNEDTIVYYYEQDGSFRVSVETLSQNSASSVIVDSGVLAEINDELFMVGNCVFDALLQQVEADLTLPNDEIIDIEYVNANGVTYYILDGDLYSYDNLVLTKRFDDVECYMQADQIYFLSGDALYNNKLATIISEGIVSIDNVCTAGMTSGIDNIQYYVNYGDGTYGDMSGLKKVENVVEIYALVNEFMAECDGYLFVDEEGNYWSFDEVVYSAEYMSSIQDEVMVVMKSDSGGYILVTAKGICIANDYIQYNSSETIVFYGGSGIAIYDSSKIVTYKLTIDSKLSTIGTYYYSNLSVVSTDTNGIVIEDSSGRQGFIDMDGKLIIKPMYESLYVTDYFIAAELINSNLSLLDHTGADITGREYVSIDTIYDNYAILYDVDGKSCMVTASGIEYTDIVELGMITNYVTSSADRVVSNYSDLTSQEIDETTNYIKFFIDGSIQILRYYL